MLGNVRVLDIRRVKIVKIIDDSDLPSAFTKQTVNKMRTDKSGPASNKYFSF